MYPNYSTTLSLKQKHTRQIHGCNLNHFVGRAQLQAKIKVQLSLLCPCLCISLVETHMQAPNTKEHPLNIWVVWKNNTNFRRSIEKRVFTTVHIEIPAFLLFPLSLSVVFSIWLWVFNYILRSSTTQYTLSFPLSWEELCLLQYFLFKFVPRISLPWKHVRLFIFLFFFPC